MAIGAYLTHPIRRLPPPPRLIPPSPRNPPMPHHPGGETTVDGASPPSTLASRRDHCDLAPLPPTGTQKNPRVREGAPLFVVPRLRGSSCPPEKPRPPEGGTTNETAEATDPPPHSGRHPNAGPSPHREADCGRGVPAAHPRLQARSSPSSPSSSPSSAWGRHPIDAPASEKARPRSPTASVPAFSSAGA